MKVTLKDGYEVNVSEEHLNDWYFIKALRKVDKGDSAMIVDIAEMLLGGEEQADALAEHLKKDGIPPADVMVDTLAEILSSVNELKNS